MKRKRLYRELDEATKQKISAGSRGKKKTEVHKQHISEAMKRYWRTIPHRPDADDNNDVQPTNDAVQ
ncbi:MAG: hypothetical protein J5801_03885 [Bacteroidales bacterium]|nr:hypothetical protein [Bacteroidales bacterium]